MGRGFLMGGVRETADFGIPRESLTRIDGDAADGSATRRPRSGVNERVALVVAISGAGTKKGAKRPAVGGCHESGQG
jgi:hypothetical protein